MLLERISLRVGACAAFALAALFLVGCGGGSVRTLGAGSSSPVVIVNPPPPTPPSIPPPAPVPVANVRVSGTMTFDFVPFKPTLGTGLDLTNPIVLPARAVTVEAIAADGMTVLASVRTDSAGGYAMTLPGNTLLHVRLKAEMVALGPPSWMVRVRDNTNGGAIYMIETMVFNTGTADSIHDLHAGSGWNNSAGAYDSAAARQAAPFAILDDIFRAHALVLSADAMAVFPELNLFWSAANKPVAGNTATGNIGTTYFDRTSTPAAIYVLGDADIDTDEFDMHVILYEWGLYYQAAFSRLDSPGGESRVARLDPRAAFSGGWAEAFAAMASGDPVYRDSVGLHQGADQNLNIDTVVATGWYSELAIAGLIYDVFDSPASDDDGVALGFAPLHAAMRGAVKSTAAFTTVYPLMHALLSDHADAAPGLQALAIARGIGDAAGLVSDDLGTGEIHDGGSAANLPVYHTLTQGAPATNVCTTDANGTFAALGNRRFFSYSPAAAGTIGINAVGAGATAAADPDVVVYRVGLEVGRGANAGNESLQLPSMTAGTYAFEVYDSGNVHPGAPGVGLACIDVSVN